MTPDWTLLNVMEETHSETRCDCCGTTAHQLSGNVVGPDGPLSGYSVTWTDGHDEPVRILLMVGDWTDGGKAAERWVFGADFDRNNKTFTLADTSKIEGRDPGVATYLDRADIVGTDFAREGIAIVDAILKKHSALKEWQG